MIAAATTIALHPLAAFAGVLAVVLLGATASLRFVQASPPGRRATRATVIGCSVVGVVVVVFAVLATGLEGQTMSVAFDDALATALSRAPWPALSTLVAGLTHLGDRTTLIGLVVAIAALLVAVRRYGHAVAWSMACIGNGLLNPALKGVFERARPPHDAAYATVGEYSFPSGHTSGAVVVYGMLAYGVIRLTPRRWHLPIVLAAATLIVAVGCSRVWLRVHWASDVIAGFASGAGWLALCVMLLERVRERADRAT